jgi:phage gpG-like protein
MAVIQLDDREFRRKLRKLSKKVKTLKPVLTKIGIEGTKNVEEHFDKERGPKQKWKKLSKRTLASRRTPKGKRKAKYGDKILQDTGRLRAIAFNVKKTSVEIGTTVDYGAVHQFGKGRIPKREWLYINAKGLTRFKKILTIELKKAV